MTRYQWWLIVFIAVGLVGMHYLVEAPTAQMMPMTMASATPIRHADPKPVRINPIEATPSAVVAPQTDRFDPMDLVGHSCLAVLTAVTALAAALIFAVAWHRPRELSICWRPSVRSGRGDRLLAAHGLSNCAY
jgi:hypothetical protein